MVTQTAQHPNALRMSIESAGYSFREISKETNIPERTLYDWAAGNRVIPHRDRETLARLLGCSPDDLAPGVSALHLLQLSQRQTDKQERGLDMDKTRRLLLQLLGFGGAALFTSPQEMLSLEPWQRLASALARPSGMDASTLDHFEKLTALCWRSSNGDSLDVVRQLLPTFLPLLSAIAQQPFEYQKKAASLASQGYQLSYVIASHREDFNAALTACEQAHHFGKVAQDANLQVAALIRQGVTFLNRKRPYQTLETYQQALPQADNVSPLVRTRLYAGLAEVHGKLQNEQEALRSIGLAHDSFPGDPQRDPASLYIHFPYSSVFLHEGLALLDLHQPKQATKALERVDGLRPKMEISERSRIDLLNQQALTAGQQGDLDRFSEYMKEAVASARELGSELRVSEAWDVFTRMSDQWKYELRIQSLRSLFAR